MAPVQNVWQEELYGCGPTVSQMVLAGVNMPAPSVPPTWQQQLWPIIQSFTWETRPSGAGPGTPYAPPFSTQLCEQCNGAWDCWATSPAALERTLNDRQPHARYSVVTGATEEAVTGVILDTIDRQLPGIALVYGRQHWLVVEGYVHSEPNATPVAGRNLNGVYLRVPQLRPQGSPPLPPSVLHYVNWLDWKDDYLSFVGCGQYANQMVVLQAVRLTPPPRVPSAPTNVRIL